MSKTITILKHELRQTLKRKSFILITIAFPLLALLGYGIIQGVQHWYHPTAPEEVKIGYVDQTGGFDKHTSQLGATFVLYPNEEEAKGALLAEEIEEYFAIPSDYLSSGLVTRYTTERERELPTLTGERIKDFLLSNLLGGETSPQIVERAKTPMLVTTLRLDEMGEIATDQNVLAQFLVPIIFAILFLLSIFFSSGFLFQSVSEEKENRVIEILLSSVSSRQLLVGKVLGLGAAGLLQIGIWLVTLKIFAKVASANIPFLSELSITTSLLAWGIVYFILGYFLFATLYAGVGSIGSTAREGQSWSMIFTMPALMPVWFSAMIIQNPEGVFARVLSLFPLTAPVTAMMRLPTQAISAWEIALSLAILAGSVAFGMWATAKIFRTCLLMYGKRPALKEIVRYVREA